MTKEEEEEEDEDEEEQEKEEDEDEEDKDEKKTIVFRVLLVHFRLCSFVLRFDRSFAKAAPPRKGPPTFHHACVALSVRCTVISSCCTSTPLESGV